MEIRERLISAGFNPTDKQVDQLSIYMKGILEFNKSINLTSITDKDEFIDKHFVDSLLVTQCDEFSSACEIVDVGTGAGFPGIPMAIMYPEKNFVLLDSLQKRLNIINQLCNECDILNVTTLHMRAEDAGRSSLYREHFDLCVSRAVAPLNVLSELCIPLVRNGGYFFAYKGPGVSDEIDAAKKAIYVTGGSIIEVRNVQPVGLMSNHNIVIIRKDRFTAPAYPRKAGLPNKKPIV